MKIRDLGGYGAPLTPLALVIVATVLIGVLGACGVGKTNEPFRDAQRGATNSAPADVIELPDGFSNLATKCDHGNRVYVAFKGDSAYGAIAIVAQDPTC